MAFFASLSKQPTFHDSTTGLPQNDDSEKRAQKFHTDDASLSRSGHCCASDFPGGKFTSEALLEGLNGVYRQPSNSLKKKWPENISKFQK